MILSSSNRLPQLLLCAFLAIFIPTVYWLQPFRGSESYPPIPQHHNPQRPSNKLPPNAKHVSTEHPIKQLHQAAVKRYESLLSSQSKSLEDAVKEYQKRYGRPPPPGFDAWYEYAKTEDSAIIDDFDMIDESMRPFWNVEPSVLRELIEKSRDAEIMQSLTLERGEFKSSEGNWMGDQIHATLQGLSSKIPDFKVAMNPLDEPRVVLSKDIPTEELKWEDLAERPAYNLLSQPCASQHQKKKDGKTVDTLGLPFQQDLSDMQNLCTHPEYETQHGFLIGPCSFRVTRSPLPILSQAVLSTTSDILYPAMWYWNHVMYDLEDFDKTWDKKRNQLYWSGSTTGGYVGPQKEGEAHFESHRFRFINITKQVGTDTYDYLARDKVGHEWIKYSSEEVLSQLYMTKFTGIVQCDGPHCDELKKTYKFGDRDDSKAMFDYKFLMDLDGNSFSGRFYNQLASNSCVLKQTIFREWHDERLIPWLHYIPISVGMHDLPETMRYLALTTEGNQIAQKVAQAGRDWHKKVLRKQDAAIYLYRLFLEYARVMSDERSS